MTTSSEMDIEEGEVQEDNTVRKEEEEISSTEEQEEDTRDRRVGG